jgi:hypothetical protein
MLGLGSDRRKRLSDGVITEGMHAKKIAWIMRKQHGAMLIIPCRLAPEVYL